ncbi:hypothetical protein D3C85_1117190 [compost metagenome]
MVLPRAATVPKAQGFFRLPPQRNAPAGIDAVCRERLPVQAVVMLQRRFRQSRVPLFDPASRRIEHLPCHPRLRRLPGVRAPVADAAHSEPARIHDREGRGCVMQAEIVHAYG